MDIPISSLNIDINIKKKVEEYDMLFPKDLNVVFSGAFPLNDARLHRILSDT